MRRNYTQKLSGFFVTLFVMFGFLVTCEYVNAVNVVLTARVKQDDGTYSPDLVTVSKNVSCSFKLMGEYNGKPPVLEEIKPDTPEWKFSSSVTCEPSNNSVIKPLPMPQVWTAGETISTTVTAKSSVVGVFRLTYEVQIRFPKLKKDGSVIKDAQGNPTYFGPYSSSVTVNLNVTDAKFKIWIESADDNFPGHSLFKLGILESGKMEVKKININDPDLVFSRSESNSGVDQPPFTLNNQSVVAGKIAGTAPIKVWAKDSNGKEYGPET
ncbi:MAG: hypothetical protein LBJ00_09700 [Planctomycetaceae bacterium]|jgi:hypothetical protein|nr:hypothetical protein [Planctomycetaceae bacterium]